VDEGHGVFFFGEDAVPGVDGLAEGKEGGVVFEPEGAVVDVLAGLVEWGREEGRWGVAYLVPNISELVFATLRGI
jgi:hypothetical protein